MKITYLAHSGFCVCLDNVQFLFDYYRGDLSKIDRRIETVVFVSHSHADHYNKEIWKWRQEFQKITYVLSKDIRLSAKERQKLGITWEDYEAICWMKPDQSIDLSLTDTDSLCKIRTLKSTDQGVAYLVECQEIKLYHAGDLNLWTWPGESPEENQEMKQQFANEMEKIAGEHFTVAFVPLDSRQEEDSFGGMDYFLNNNTADHIFPMHFWDKPEIITEYLAARQEQPQIEKIITLKNGGETYEF